jgi:hypothetical protein
VYEAGRKTLLSKKIEILTKRNGIKIRKVNPADSINHDTSKYRLLGSEVSKMADYKYPNPSCARFA